MNYWKLYKNEIIVGMAVFLLVIALIYKQQKVSNQNNAGEQSTELSDLQEVISLKKIWGDKRITKKVENLKNIVSPSKVKWSRKGKKLQAQFQNISAQELNRLVVKVMNVAVEIQKLDVQKSGMSYIVELKCKW